MRTHDDTLPAFTKCSAEEEFNCGDHLLVLRNTAGDFCSIPQYSLVPAAVPAEINTYLERTRHAKVFCRVPQGFQKSITHVEMSAGTTGGMSCVLFDAILLLTH